MCPIVGYKGTHGKRTRFADANQALRRNRKTAAIPSKKRPRVWGHVSPEALQLPDHGQARRDCRKTKGNMPTYERCPKSVNDLANEVLTEFETHKPLLDVKIKIDFVFAFPDLDEKSGE